MLLDYFNLNKREFRAPRFVRDGGAMEYQIHTLHAGVKRPIIIPEKTVIRSNKASQSNGINLRIEKSLKSKRLSTDRLSLWDQLFMYVGVFIGVLLSSAITQYKTGSPISLKLNLATILISSVVALIIVPQAFEKLKMQSSSPFIVRFGFFVQNGVFWRVIFEAVGKSLSN